MLTWEKVRENNDAVSEKIQCINESGINEFLAISWTGREGSMRIGWLFIYLFEIELRRNVGSIVLLEKGEISWFIEWWVVFDSAFAHRMVVIRVVLDIAVVITIVGLIDILLSAFCSCCCSSGRRNIVNRSLFLLMHIGHAWFRFEWMLLLLWVLLRLLLLILVDVWMGTILRRSRVHCRFHAHVSSTTIVFGSSLFLPHF